MGSLLASERPSAAGDGIRQQADLPQRFYGAAVGSLLASERPSAAGGRDSPASWSPTAFLRSRCGKLACKRTSQRGRGRDSPASWSPTAFLRSRCGKLACKRTSQRGRGRDSPASWSPTAFLQSLCGKLACKRTFQRGRGAGFASKLVSHSVSTESLWEACLQANVPARQGGGIRQQAGLPQRFYRASVGSLLASERGCCRSNGVFSTTTGIHVPALSLLSSKPHQEPEHRHAREGTVTSSEGGPS